jgi:hypothetical protein
MDGCFYDLSASTYIVIPQKLSFPLKRHFANLCREFQSCFLSGLELTAAVSDLNRTFMRVKLEHGLAAAQGYTLECDANGLSLNSSDEAGLFYGLQSLRQILQDNGSRVPGFSIIDAPDIAVRGVMLDISRCKVPTMDTLLHLVDKFAELRYNHLQLYMEHTFAYSKHEAVWRGCSPMTPAEILELDSYCRERYIELVPCQNSFAHMERWLKHPEYANIALNPNGVQTDVSSHQHSFTLRPDTNSVKFMSGLYDELLSNFSSNLVNICCDETWELGWGEGNTIGMKLGRDRYRLHLEFVNSICGVLRERGKRVILSGDMANNSPELLKELPDDIIAQCWGYESDHSFAKTLNLFKEAGIETWVSPGTSTWNALIGRTNNCLENIKTAMCEAKIAGSKGLLLCDWGDGGHHQYQPFSYFGYVAGAAHAWRMSSGEYDWATLLDRFFFDADKKGLGDLFVEAGKIHEELPVVPNSSAFGRLLLYTPGEESLIKFMDNVSPPAFSECITKLDKMLHSSLFIRSMATDVNLVMDEFRNNVRMARFSCWKGLELKGAPRIDQNLKKKEAGLILDEHRRLWIARNRSGGLDESADLLKRRLF